MTGKALVGPMPNTVRFNGGGTHWRTPRSLIPAVVYSVPRDTRDPRYLTCRAHRVACDCREADHAEMVLELRSEARLVEDTISRVLAGHLTHAEPGVTPCACTGCQIVRDSYNWNKAQAER